MRSLNKIILAAGAMAALSVSAQAADVTSPNGKFYLGADAGLYVANDIKFNVTDSNNAGSGKFSFKNGYEGGVFAGYKVNRFLKAEAQVGYSTADFKGVNGSFTDANANVYSGGLSVGGSMDTWTGMANAIVTPLGDRYRISPYIGGGIGFAHVNVEVNKVADIAVSASNSETDFAMQGIVGVDYAVTKNFDLGARYRYGWVNTSDNGLDAVTSHTFSLTGKYKF